MLKALAWRTVVAAVACVALTMLVAAPAGAAPAWLAPVNLSAAAENAEGPQVAVDPQGDAVAVWARSNGTENIIQGTVRPAGGLWQEPVNLSILGENAEDPQVAVDPKGNAIAVWARSNGTNYIVQSAVRPAGGAWQEPVELSPPGEDAYEPQVAVDPQGDAVAVWSRYNGTNYIVQGAARPAGGAWQEPVELSAAGEDVLGAQRNPQVAVDPQGNAIAVWSGGTSEEVIRGAVRPAGGAWQEPVDLSAAGEGLRNPQVAVDPQGDAIAVWERYSGSIEIVQSAVRPAASGVWQTPVDLAGSARGEVPQVALDPQGNAVAVWKGYNGTNFNVQSAVRPAGGTWQTPVVLSTVGEETGEPQVAVDPQGNAVAVWKGYNGTNFIVQGAVRPAGGAWQTPVVLSAAGENAESPKVAVDPQGNAVAVWLRSNGTNGIAQAAGYDAAGPFLNNLSIPSSGSTGQPLTFSVSPLDVWSALGETKWNFGDGATASTTSATHAYATAGSYPVKVTSADVLGNTTSASATITIAPAATTVPTKSAACTVPKLKGKKLKAAKKDLTKADCKLGKVKGHKTKSAKVKKQSPRSGTVLAPGAKVSVKLS